MASGDPLQWIVIGVIVEVIFLWGPQKIPDIARALSRARGE
ncbi:MAG: twin-arginine translocase TatA/TatE family subunit [Nitrososphaerales archaeon]|nr:twin-arginine translocase TatA/TatE family subunit [Nitrososphaerales archaeon]